MPIVDLLVNEVGIAVGIASQWLRWFSVILVGSCFYLRENCSVNIPSPRIQQYFFFFWKVDLLTCKTHKKKQQQNNSTQCQTIANIAHALMKQFNLFPVMLFAISNSLSTGQNNTVRLWPSGYINFKFYISTTLWYLLIRE